MRHVHVPEASQIPPRTLPSDTQLVEHVDQQSIDCGDGAADVVAARARNVPMRAENCILMCDGGMFEGEVLAL